MTKIISAGFIVKSRDGKILLGKVNRHKPPYQWTVFKGGKEGDEDLISTAMRELKEETGIDIVKDDRLNKNISISPIFEYKLKHKDVYMFLLDDIEGALDNFEFKCESFWEDEDYIHEEEINGYDWFDIEEIKYYIFPSQRGLASFLEDKYAKCSNSN